MKVLLLGATGRTGKHLLSHLLQDGYNVSILVRDKNKVTLASNRLELFEGVPTDHKALLLAAEGCKAILSVLNISRTSDFPWAKLRTPDTFLSGTMINILQVANEKNISRVIVCSAWGVHETKKDIPAWFRWVINNSNVGTAYRDHERQEHLLANTALNYTIVRPVGLTNSKKDSTIKISIDNSPRPSWTISRKNVAKCMVQLLKDNSYARQAITISND